MTKITEYLFLLVCIFVTESCFCQQKDTAAYTTLITDSTATALQGLPSKYYSKVDKKLSSVNDQLTKKSIKYLAKFQRQEKRLQQMLQQLHPELTLTNADDKYNELTQKIKSKTGGLSKLVGGEYNPSLSVECLNKKVLLS